MIIISQRNDIINIYKITKNNNHGEKILFKGSFNLMRTNNDLTIQDLKLIKDSKEISITSSDLVKILKKEIIIVSSESNQLISFLKEERIDYEIKSLCNFCEKRENIRILESNEIYQYKNRQICKECAKNVLRDKILSKGYVDYLGRNYDFLLEKFHNIDELIEILEDNPDPLNNEKLTLYDTLPATEKDYKKVLINDLDIPEELKNILSQRIETLMPVQISAIEKGLLENNNLLVVSQTASGKTLIGELAGIPKALKKRKMIYLSPLVALANQKYRDFKKDYEKLGLSVAIKVGHHRIKTEDELYIPEKPIDNADIIVATYEGLDYILRSGCYEKLEELGTVIIDEIHMLENEERGHRLNGLINRLITIFPNAQLIGLSATIKNSKELAKEFSMKLVEYDKRPVEIERHFVNTKNEKEKKELILTLCKKEFEIISSKGYHGQSIIFTDSRRKTQIIAGYLKKNGLDAEYYHAGLTYAKKVEIEEAFLNQEISTVVTTAALANGIDFPSSMVIFESIHMGIDYLTNNEFHQMLGRAGRPSFHDIGKAYVIVVSPDNIESLFNQNDYMIAMELLKNDVDSIHVLYNRLDVFEQVLADICAIRNVGVDTLKDRYEQYWIPITFNEAISLLLRKKMIFYDKSNQTYHPTKYGESISKSFISVDEAEIIKKNIYDDLIETVLLLVVIHNAYFSEALLNKFSSIFNYNVGSNIFSDRNREIISEGGYIDHLGRRYQNNLITVYKDFMNCDCYDPYCKCFEKNISKHVIDRRIQGWTPKEISNEFKREYELRIYPGDIYSYLDQVVMKLEAIKRISYSLEIFSTAKKCEKLIHKIEEGK